MHEDAAVGDGVVAVDHLDHVDGKALAEGFGGEFGFGPVFKEGDLAFFFSVEFDVGFFEEAEFVEVVIEKCWADFFSDEGHAGIEGFG